MAGRCSAHGVKRASYRGCPGTSERPSTRFTYAPGAWLAADDVKSLSVGSQARPSSVRT